MDYLQARRWERDALLRGIQVMLEGDERMVAAWLHGSLGRGTDDQWSDLDLWVVVADAYMDEMLATKRNYAARVGEPLIIVDAPNAPPGGAFLSVVYGGLEGGPQHVDWTWQPQSSASVPGNVRVLFNRGGITQAAPGKEESAEERVARARHQVSYFWMMVPIVAKYIARCRAWNVLELLSMVGYTVDELKWLVDESANPTAFNGRSQLPPLSRPNEQLSFLRQLAGEMEVLMSEVEALQGMVSEQAVTEIYLLLERTEQLLPG